ncbi:MAG TPA: Txe/YoeB family addiction module toxin [Verrucomicrobiae bacterium]|nr:Txe/YoeB family addiction module toxin [Verrucomicrobiae bacterium]
MKLMFAEQAWEDYLFWQQTDKRITRRIHELIKDATRNPFSGLGKPEPLRHALAGFWSRRITEEHRMVYRVAGNNLLLAQLRYHY